MTKPFPDDGCLGISDELGMKVVHIVSSNLKWNDNIESLTKKASKRIYSVHLVKRVWVLHLIILDQYSNMHALHGSTAPRNTY